MVHKTLDPLACRLVRRHRIHGKTHKLEHGCLPGPARTDDAVQPGTEEVERLAVEEASDDLEGSERCDGLCLVSSAGIVRSLPVIIHQSDEFFPK